MLDISLAAALQLRSVLRSMGVAGIPAVRLKTTGLGDDLVEVVVEDRMMPGDAVAEARGIRVYMDEATATALRHATLDLEGTDFVLRRASGAGSSPP